MVLDYFLQPGQPYFGLLRPLWERYVHGLWTTDVKLRFMLYGHSEQKLQ